MKYGIALGAANPRFFAEVAAEADRLGFESVWLPEHLVLTSAMSRSPYGADEHPPIPPTIPVFDAFGFLAFIAGRTERIRLGTHVYNIGLRHPFVTARAVQTLDIVSGGRVEFGIGASWLEEEWVAAELDFASRGRRVDETIEVCKRLWTDDEVSHHGEFFSFENVVFLPKPVQSPWPPIMVGGDSDRALRRAAEHGDGWIGMARDLDDVARSVVRLRELLDARDRDPRQFEFCISAQVGSLDDVQRYEDAGLTRLVIAPWTSAKEANDGMRRFADLVGLDGS